ncbi:MAG: hypothetical protein J2P30_11935 [Actinobacteria bacterium]|nr:hypothetical protein [Actinomycetota bacterium]
MSRPASAAPLRLVHPATTAVDELLAALDQWARAGLGEPVAYLEAGDGELAGDFPLTAEKVTELASLLRRAADSDDRRAPRVLHPRGGQT